MSSVKVEGVVKRFFPTSSLFKGKGEAVVALDYVHLNVRDKEVFCIIGPSGCGKTTLLRCIAGLESVDEGSIYIDERKVNHLPPKDRHIGMVFQNLALYPHLTVRKNLTFSLEMRNLPGQLVEERVRRVCDILGKGFKELLDRKPWTLSEGEKRKVALGRCIIQDVSLFLMDEPLANLDPESSMQIRLEMVELLNKLEKTVIYVTHDQYEVPTVAERVGIMREGRLEQVGTFSEVYNRPVNRFVATFLGDPPMNILRLVLKEDKRGLYLMDPPFRINLPGEKYSVLKEKGYLWKELLVGIRPEHVNLGESKKPLPDRCCFKGKVEVCCMSLSKLLVRVEVGTQVMVVTLQPFLRIQRGEVIPLWFSLDNMVIFDSVTERAIF